MNPFAAPTEKEKKRLRPKVQMGGSVFKNDKNVDKEVEAQTRKKHAVAKKMGGAFKNEKGEWRDKFIEQLEQHKKDRMKFL